MQRVVYVAFKDRAGGMYAHVTMATSLFEAVRRGAEWFHCSLWKGPRPGPETVFEVSLVGDARQWRVRADILKTFALNSRL